MLLRAGALSSSIVRLGGELIVRALARMHCFDLDEHPSRPSTIFAFRDQPTKVVMRQTPSALRFALATTGTNTVEQNVAELAKTARQELHEWATMPQSRWKSNSLVRRYLFILVWIARVFGFGRMFGSGAGFWRSYARAGGESRIKMLLTFARFDADNSGDISSDELNTYYKYGEETVKTTNDAFQSMSMMLTLLIAASINNVLGRPVPWVAGMEAIEAFGPTAATALSYACFVLSAIVELLALACLSCCILNRWALRARPARDLASRTLT